MCVSGLARELVMCAKIKISVLGRCFFCFFLAWQKFTASFVLCRKKSKRLSLPYSTLCSPNLRAYISMNTRTSSLSFALFFVVVVIKRRHAT